MFNFFCEIQVLMKDVSLSPNMADVLHRLWSDKVVSLKKRKIRLNFRMKTLIIRILFQVQQAYHLSGDSFLTQSNTEYFMNRVSRRDQTFSALLLQLFRLYFYRSALWPSTTTSPATRTYCART